MKIYELVLLNYLWDLPARVLLLLKKLLANKKPKPLDICDIPASAGILGIHFAATPSLNPLVANPFASTLASFS